MIKRNPDKMKHRNGFTLVEVLIAIFILALVMSTVYVSYSGTLRISHQMEEESNIYKMARWTMDRLIRDLSSLQPSGNSFYLTAEKEKIDRKEFHTIHFWSAAHLAFGEKETSGRPATVSYYVREEGSEGSVSLWRADVSGARPDEKKETAKGYVICKNIEAFKLTFYDQQDRDMDLWNTSPASGHGEQLPRTIKIELALSNIQDKEKPYKFMTRIYLPSPKRTP